MMRPISILDRYIVRSVLGAVGVVAVVIGAMMLLMLFIGEADQIGDGRYGLPQVLLYIAAMMPSRIQLVLPVVSLLGALMALGALAAGSELLVIRSAGVSMRRLAVSVGLAGLVLALLAVGLGEYLAPTGTRAGTALRDKARHGKVEASLDNGLWLRYGQTALRIHSTLPGGRIQGLDVYELDQQGRLKRALAAEHARLVDHELVVAHPRYTDISVNGTQTARPDQLKLDIDIDPQVLALAVTQPSELSSFGLWRYIEYLDRNHINASDYRLALWRNIVTPFTVWIMVVFALPFAFGSLRSAGAGQRLFIGGLLGLVFFLVNEIVASTGPVYGIAPWLAASLPTAVLGGATVYWMRRLN